MNPLYKLAAIALVVLGVAGAVTFAIHRYGNGRAEAARAEATAKGDAKLAKLKAQWDAERAALQAKVQSQFDRNLELQRAAEKQYVVQGEIRDHYITNTVIEVRHETANLAACVVSAPAVRMFNDAGRCASEDSAAACGADGKVPDTATTR
jgi:hypothetical protein